MTAPANSHQPILRSMPTVPTIPETAPFTAEQRAWLNGYLAGLFSRGEVQSHVAATGKPSTPALQPLTILFGSQTGTAESLAKRAAKEAGKRGFAATIIDMAQTSLTKLATEKNLLVITSTYGEGEPPDNAKALHAALAAAAPGRTLTSLRFSVCALGDTNYVQFCKCGKDFDSFLDQHGAKRVAPRVDCELEYEAKFTGWLSSALGAFSAEDGASNAGPISTATPTTNDAAENSSPTAEPAYSRSKPFSALLLASRNLNGEGSAKQVHHVEIDLADSGLSYEAGDALGVYPHNCPEVVNEVLTMLECDGEEAVPAPDGSTVPLRRALTEMYDIGRPTPDLLERFGSAGGGGTAVALHHVIDLLHARVDVKLGPGDFVRGLKKLQPRLYSISSSPRAHAGQVHLTVGALRYDAAGRPRKGVCSTFLADRVVAGETRVGVFVHANAAFRLPADDGRPVIMVGPGTGIAPFRAFLHDRRARGAKGKNWLFFGDQRSATDFLYREEMQSLQNEGLLSRFDVAWSRDQQEKVYVQNRMLAEASELYAWLESGAHFYVCGDASRMAKDVDAALHRVVERAGGKTAEQAAEYVQSLRSTKRYCRDVY